MSKEELIIGFFEKGYCCDLDEVKDTCLGLLKENQELKKQLEEYKNGYFKLSEEKDNYAIKFHKYKTQQKEFIKYLEDEIKIYENNILNFSKDYKVYFSLINDLRVSKAKIKEILQKYKKIIGVSDENNNE